MKMKKFLSAILAGTMLLSSMTALAADEPALPQYSCEPIEGEDLLIEAQPFVSGATKNARLDAGMVFTALESADDAAESEYADWLVDCEVEFSKTTTAEAMGAYQNVHNGKWQNLGSIEFAGGKTYKLMEEKVDGEESLSDYLEALTGERNTYANIVDYVGELKCGMVFDKETEVGTTVTISLTLTNPDTDDKKIVGTETFIYEGFALPKASVRALEGDELIVGADGVSSSTVNQYVLDYGMVFTATEDLEAAKAAPYANWITDFEIEFSKETTVTLVGQYDKANNGKPLALPSYTCEAGVAYGVLNTSELDKEFEALFGTANTYAAIVEIVDEFKCGVVLDAASFGTDITLRLCVTDDWTGEKYAVYEEVFTIGDLHETTDTDEEIAESINNLPQEKVEIFADDIKDAIANLDQESKNAIEPEVIKTLVADKIDENKDKPAVYTAEDNITVDIQPTDAYDQIPESFATADTYDIVVEKNGNELETVDIPVLVAIPVPAGTTKDDIDKVVHVHNGVEKEITNFFIENDILYFTMSEFSYVGIFYNVTPATGGAVLKLVEAATQPKGKAVYDVVLEGDSVEAVKNFVSGEFTVKVSGNSASYNYDIVANNPEETTIGYQNVDGGRKYRVYLNGTDVANDVITGFDKTNSWTAKITDKSLVLGTLTITSYGQGSIVLSNPLMVKHNGESDNIATKIETTVGNATSFDIAVPTQTLTVNVTFNNKIENVDPAYNDMSVTIKGRTVNVTKNIGKDVSGVVFDEANCTYTITAELPENDTYEVKVVGEGYRTAPYNVTMRDSAKTLNFWNNYEDNAQVVEVGLAESAVNANFLAGDIVADNKINIYDLSAVVSYFGEEGLTATNNGDYVQYDLNRDGKIDSMDVAYVLVSWDK